VLQRPSTYGAGSLTTKSSQFLVTGELTDQEFPGGTSYRHMNSPCHFRCARLLW
jgi:hypothetical protein